MSPHLPPNIMSPTNPFDLVLDLNDLNLHNSNSIMVDPFQLDTSLHGLLEHNGFQAVPLPPAPPSHPTKSIPDSSAPATLHPESPGPKTPQPETPQPETPQPETPVRSQSPIEEKASVGRLGSKFEGILEAGFKEIDAIIARLARETKISSEQVQARYKKRNEPLSTSTNMWNLYQVYHKANISDEMGRLEDGYHIGGK